MRNEVISQLAKLAVRECKIFRHNPIFPFCMVVFPLMVIFFFTSVLELSLIHI